jgi:hypothetical protein
MDWDQREDRAPVETQVTVQLNGKVRKSGPESRVPYRLSGLGLRSWLPDPAAFWLALSLEGLLFR